MAADSGLCHQSGLGEGKDDDASAIVGGGGCTASGGDGGSAGVEFGGRVFEIDEASLVLEEDDFAVALAAELDADGALGEVGVTDEFSIFVNFAIAVGTADAGRRGNDSGEHGIGMGGLEESLDGGVGSAEIVHGGDHSLMEDIALDGIAGIGGGPTSGKDEGGENGEGGRELGHDQFSCKIFVKGTGSGVRGTGVLVFSEEGVYFFRVVEFGIAKNTLKRELRVANSGWVVIIRVSRILSMGKLYGFGRFRYTEVTNPYRSLTVMDGNAIGILVAKVVLALIIMQMLLGLISYLILLERKTAAWIQDRVGPNRTGPKGLLQPIADGVKFILKEEFIPLNADKFLFILAPIAILTPAMVGFAVIPWGGILKGGSSVLGLWSFPTDFPFMVSNASVGVLVVVAMAGLATYGVVLGGWASGSKYSFLGGLRATAQMLSYEVPLALALMCVLLTVGTLNLETMTESQAHYWFGLIPKWNIFVHPLAAFIFTTAIFAEANRTPFDLAECESELVGGYHTEYSSMKFALFFLAEYASMITGSAVMIALFLGGWHLPWIDKLIYHADQPAVGNWIDVLIKFTVFWGKVVAFMFFYMWIRWTLPRFRFDQLMNLAWRGMIPVSLAALLVTGLVVYLEKAIDLQHPSIWILIANFILFGIALLVIGRRPTTQNKRVPVPNSRYNPQFTQELAAQAAAEAAL